MRTRAICLNQRCEKTYEVNYVGGIIRCRKCNWKCKVVNVGMPIVFDVKIWKSPRMKRIITKHL